MSKDTAIKRGRSVGVDVKAGGGGGVVTARCSDIEKNEFGSQARTYRQSGRVRYEFEGWRHVSSDGSGAG